MGTHDPLRLYLDLLLEYSKYRNEEVGEQLDAIWKKMSLEDRERINNAMEAVRWL